MSFTFHSNLTNSNPITNDQTNPRFDKELFQDPYKDGVKATLNQCNYTNTFLSAYTTFPLSINNTTKIDGLVLDMNNVYGSNTNASIPFPLGNTGGSADGKTKGFEVKKGIQVNVSHTVMVDTFHSYHGGSSFHLFTPDFETKNERSNELKEIVQVETGETSFGSVMLEYPTQQRTKQFNNRVFVYLEGEKFCTVLFNPLNLKHFQGRKDISRWQMEHKQLLRDWIPKLSGISDLFEAPLEKVAQLDIAIDTPRNHDIKNMGAQGKGLGIVRFLNHVDDDLAYRAKNKKNRARRIEHMGRTELSTAGARDGQTGEFNTIYIGRPFSKKSEGKSKKSDKFIRCYNKTLELKDNAEKRELMEAYWKHCGMVIGEDGEGNSVGVDRVELSMKGVITRKIECFNWQKLDNPQYLISIFRTMTTKDKDGKGSSMFEFAKFTEKTINKRKAERVQIIDWDSIGAERLNVKVHTTAKEERRVKRTMRGMYFMYCTHESKEVRDAMKAGMRAVYNDPRYSKFIADYIERKYPEWQKEFVREMLLGAEIEAFEALDYPEPEKLGDKYTEKKEEYECAKSRIEHLAAVTIPNLDNIFGTDNNIDTKEETKEAIRLKEAYVPEGQHDDCLALEYETKTGTVLKLYRGSELVGLRIGKHNKGDLMKAIRSTKERLFNEVDSRIEKMRKENTNMYQSGYYCPNGYPNFWDK